MKKLIKLFIVMVVLCTTACTQIFDNRNDIDQMKNVGRLVMKVEKNSRSINPTFQESDIKTAVLTANGNEIKSWSGDNIISQIENTEDILLDVGNYDFTMIFRNADNIDILTASTNQDIVAGNNSLVFDMKPVTTGNGNISITLTWDVSNGIDKITAGLYDIATNDPLEGFEDSVLEITTSNEQISTAPYSLSGVPVGQYIIKFKIYECETYEKLLNTLSEVINVAAGITTSSQITLSKINTQYSIFYETNGGEWADNFIPTYNHNANEKIILPTANDITREGYEFGGWYDDDNNRITEIPSDTAKDISVTAKWYNAICDRSNVCEVIRALSETGPHDILVTGEMHSNFIAEDIKPALADALKENQNIKVNLDLSQTTGMNEITTYAFEGMSGLSSVILPDSVTSIGTYAFQYCSNLKSINIPNGVTSIEAYTFNGCSSLTEIIIPDSVTSIAYNAFTDCNAVKTLVTGNGLTSLDYLPITSALESVTIGDSITEIGAEKFKNFTKLTSVTFADNSQLTEIGDSAFSHCSQLTSITFPESVTTIGINVFDACSELTSFIVHESNQNFSTLEDGKILCDKNKKTLIAYPSASDSITIPDGITTIAGNAFVDCTELTGITIPDSVTSIGNGAFGRTGFTNVQFPDSVIEMGTDIFSGCSNLETVKLPNNITSIPRATFFMCDNLREIVIPSSVTSIGDIAFSACYALTCIDIPNSVTIIERNAFSDCSSLASVTIGNGVTSIGETAFGGCYSLTTVNYRGTQDQWEQIVIDSTNYELTSVEINYNYTGE